MSLRIFFKARFWTWRTRSRVTLNFAPNSSRVNVSWQSRPKRIRRMSASRFSSESSMLVRSDLRLRSRTFSNGLMAFSSATISPKVLEPPSALMGASSEVGWTLTDLRCATFSAGRPSSMANSSTDGSRPSSSARAMAARRIREIFSNKWTGKRMIFDWLASARLIACLIHHAP